MIAVLGAGSIGCYVGGMLAASGVPVTLIGRPKVLQALADGFSVTPIGGSPIVVSPELYTLSSEPAAMAGAATILVCVKSGDTAEAAQLVRTHAPGVNVVSLQNGITNPMVLANALGSANVSTGMVGFNVIRAAPDAYVQTTAGEVILDEAGAALANLLAQTKIAAICHRNMAGVQWSKLLMNLNNALNALSGVGLKTQLEDRGWRLVLAACIAEGLLIARAEGANLERIGKVHPRMLPFLLRLPNCIFSRIAQSMLRVDPAARSSMFDDYQQGRSSEIAWLNGFIVDQGNKHGIATPANERVCELINAAFSQADRPELRQSAASILN